MTSGQFLLPEVIFRFGSRNSFSFSFDANRPIQSIPIKHQSYIWIRVYFLCLENKFIGFVKNDLNLSNLSTSIICEKYKSLISFDFFQ